MDERDKEVPPNLKPRSGGDRRRAERRLRMKAAAAERRGGNDRRKVPDRRTGTAFRHSPPPDQE